MHELFLGGAMLLAIMMFVIGLGWMSSRKRGGQLINNEVILSLEIVAIFSAMIMAGSIIWDGLYEFGPDIIADTATTLAIMFVFIVTMTVVTKRVMRVIVAPAA